MNKIVKLVVSLLITAATTGGLFYAGNNMATFSTEEYSDTFVGYVSENVYDTEEKTAKAYLSCELSGATAEPVYTGYRKIADLSKPEIVSLGVTELTDKNILNGEKVAIDYKCNSNPFTANTYFLNTSEGYLYYIPPQETGEALTNSYFNTVLDGVKYSNCTSTTTVNMRVISSEVTTDATYRQVIYFDDDKAFFNQELPGFDTDMYFAEGDGNIIVYLQHPKKNDGKFWTLADINRDLRNQGSAYYYEYYKVYITKGGETIDVDTFDKMQDIIDLMFMMDLDASYFVKTNVGFSMTNDKYKDVCKMMAGDGFASEIEDAWDDYHVHFRADYYVSDGRLSGSQVILTMSNGDDIFALNLETKYSNFGSTEVIIPN